MSLRPCKRVSGAPVRSELLFAWLGTTASVRGVLMVALFKLRIKRYNARKARTTRPVRCQLLYHCPTTNRSFKWASLLLRFPKDVSSAGSCAVHGSGSRLAAHVDRSSAHSRFAALFLLSMALLTLMTWQVSSSDSFEELLLQPLPSYHRYRPKIVTKSVTKWQPSATFGIATKWFITRKTTRGCIFR